MTIAALLVAAVLAAPAADPPPGDPALLAKWTQPTATSFRDWSAARAHRTAYPFIWTTDDCTGGPERPLGFDFRAACRRHDFGYRNYRALGRLAAVKPRLDRAFHADLRRACAGYRPAVRPVCNGLAWTYYRAARRFGG